MLRCDLCGAEVVEGEPCPEDHALLDPMLVLPTGAPAAEDGQGPIRLRLAEPGETAALSAHLLSEALTALADAQTPAMPQPEPIPLPPTDDPPTDTVVEPEGSLEQVEQPVAKVVGSIPSAMPSAVELFGKPSGAIRLSRRRRKLLVPLVAVLVLATAGYVVLRPGAANAATYRLALAAGETHHYAFRLSINGEVGVPASRERVRMSMAMDMTERVTDVDPSGVATVRQRIDGGTLRLAGETVRIPKTTITLRLTPDGRIVGIDGAGGLGCSGADPSTQFISPSQLYPAFPSAAIAPGDEWTVRQRYPNPLTDEAFSVTTRNRLVRLGDDGVALIRSDITMPMKMDLKMADVARAIRRACGGSAGADLSSLPGAGSVSYDGEMTMHLTQMVERATGRPVSVTGTGAMDLAMTFDGPWASGTAIQMNLDFDVSFVERAETARDKVKSA